MDNSFSKIMRVFLAVAFVFTGCQRGYEVKTVNSLDSEPNIVVTSAPPDYVVKAIEAVGGMNAWRRTKKIQLDGVVTFYQSDGSFYLTEQNYVVYPWSNSIQVSAHEPHGTFIWQLSRGKFDVLQKGGQSDVLPVDISSNDFSEMVLSIMTIPARLYDESAEFSRETTGLKIQGQWYFPVTRLSNPTVGTKSESEPAAPLSKAVFFQDRDNFLIDMLLFDFTGRGNNLAVRGYDYTKIEKGGVLVPARIEIFRADARGNLQQRLVKIDNQVSGR
ncbi:MAG: hypothetical protein JW837_02520 [Sedimentisphaerales bacterium]|nr:hypothetical protein [Sedimentisphaerales bacterium]